MNTNWGTDPRWSGIYRHYSLGDVQRLQGELVYIDSVQRSMFRDTIENASSIQLLAQRNE